LLLKIELKTSSGIPAQRQRPITNIQLNHENRYKMYTRAVYEKFNCIECSKQLYCVEKCTIENCVCGCNSYMCMKCVATSIVTDWGSRLGALETKYLQGLMKCINCKKKGRVIHSLTGQYLTKFKNEDDY
jgi:hypothetical protein